ncbi:MAG: hypothetical protein ABJA67_09795 [Chthonomonadales bacterium]
MDNPFAKKLADLLANAAKSANEFVNDREVSIVRGKVAGKDVHAEDGSLIIAAGSRVDEEVIAHAEREHKMHALTASVGSGGVQDLREHVQNHVGTTTDSVEAQSLDTLDEAVEARTYIGRIATVDVTDVRGSVVIKAGTEIRGEHITLARDQGLISALLYSAKLPDPPKPEVAPLNEDFFTKSTVPVSSVSKRTLPMMEEPGHND